MLKLRRAIVLDAGSAPDGTAAREQRLTVELSDAPGARRPAIADIGLVGRAELGDELIVNTEALDLGLGWLVSRKKWFIGRRSLARDHRPPFS